MLSAAFILLTAGLIADFILKKRVPAVAAALSAAGGILLLLFWIRRSAAIGFPALTSSYEGLIFFALCLVPASLILEKTQKQSAPARAGLALALVLLILASSPLFPQEAQPPVPALRSHWLVLHVAFAFLGESLFALGFFASVAWLLNRDGGKREWLDLTAYRLILGGFFLYTLGALVFGAVWASYAWGRFWGWDPKETWALITWLTYSYYLHIRIFSKKAVRRSHWVSAAGFIFTLITFLGVKYLSGDASSLHGY